MKTLASIAIGLAFFTAHTEVPLTPPWTRVAAVTVFIAYAVIVVALDVMMRRWRA